MHNSKQFRSSMPASSGTWSHSGLRAQEAQFPPLCSLFHFKKWWEGGRECMTLQLQYISSHWWTPLPPVASLQTLHLTDVLTMATQPQLSRALLEGCGPGSSSWGDSGRAKEEMRMKMRDQTSPSHVAHRLCYTLFYMLRSPKRPSVQLSTLQNLATIHLGSNTAHTVQRHRPQRCSTSTHI